MSLLPKKGYVNRMNIYLTEMYPVIPRFAAALLLALSFHGFLLRIHGGSVLQPVSIFSFAGVVSVFLLMLILRLMDELKDREIDLQLFTHRPLPSGKVFESDIWFSIVAVGTCYLGVNAWVGTAFWFSVVVLAYAVLMFNYFFIPGVLRKYLLLNLATHNPVIPILLVYLVSLFVVGEGIAFSSIRETSTIVLIACYWALLFAWEISRKIRSAEEENAYVTYSQIFGRGGAVLVVAGAQTIAFAAGLFFYFTLDLSAAFAFVLVIGYAATLWGHLQFALKPSPRTSKLRPYAERYILCVCGAQVVDMARFFYA